jgi:hypothetical protein
VAVPVASFETIPDGFRGTEATVRVMHRFANKGKTDLTVQKIVDSIIAKTGCKNRDYQCKAQALYDFVKSYIRFERDPFGVEMVQEPLVTLKRKAGDCDDHATLIAAMFGAIGYPYSFKTIKADRRRPSEFSHIYTIINIPGKGWVGADTSVDPAYLGWEPPGHHPSKVWPPMVN